MHRPILGKIKTDTISRESTGKEFAAILADDGVAASKLFGRIAKIDRGGPSSKRCACYGAINKELKLSARDWPCVTCGKIHDRNASQGLRTEAIVEGIVILKAAGLFVAAHGGCIRPARIAQAAANELGSLRRQA
jgi:hypothetical protein